MSKIQKALQALQKAQAGAEPKSNTPGPSESIRQPRTLIAHGVDLANNLRQQDLAVRSGHWPLFRYDPRQGSRGKNPLHLDSRKPTLPFRDFASTEARFSVLWRSHPDAAERMLRQTESDIAALYRHYEQLAAMPGASKRSAEEDKS